MTYDTSNNRLYVYNSGWYGIQLTTTPSPFIEENKIRSRSGSIISLHSEKSERDNILFEIDKLAAMKPDKYRDYMDTIDKLVKMKRSLTDMESDDPDVDREWELNTQ